MENRDSTRIAQGLDDLTAALTSCPENKALVIQVISSMIASSEWPHSFGTLRRQTLAELLGPSAANFLVDYVLDDKLPIELEYPPAIKSFLDMCNSMFESSFKRARDFSLHPLAIHSLQITATAAPSVVIRMHRNDGQFIDIDGEPERLFGIIRILLTALDAAEDAYGTEMDRSELFAPTPFHGLDNREDKK